MESQPGGPHGKNVQVRTSHSEPRRCPNRARGKALSSHQDMADAVSSPSSGRLLGAVGQSLAKPSGTAFTSR